MCKKKNARIVALISSFLNLWMDIQDASIGQGIDPTNQRQFQLTELEINIIHLAWNYGQSNSQIMQRDNLKCSITVHYCK